MQLSQNFGTHSLRSTSTKTRKAIALLLPVLGCLPMHALAEPITDRLAQIQSSLTQIQAALSAFAAATTAQLTVIADRLAPPTSPVAISTGLEFKPADHFGECRAVNVSTVAGNVRFRLMRADGTEIASSTNTLQPGQGTTFSQILGSPAASMWCRFEPQDVGMQLRASLNISNPVTGLSVVSREAR
jgi:hypothetical protein